MQIYASTGTLIGDFTVKDESYRYRAIMGENALTLYIAADSYIDIPVGAYTDDFAGERYTLLRPQNFVKNNTQHFEYTVILESAKSLLNRYKFREVVYAGGVYGGTKRLKFSLTAQPREHLQMLVDNLNERNTETESWSIGDCIDGVENTLSYSHTGCDEALKMIAELYKVEYEVIGKVISIKKLEYNKTLLDALALSYGFSNGVGNGFKSGIKRDNFENSKAIEILFIQGGEKNVNKTTYGSAELRLPKNDTVGYEGRVYQSDADGLSLVNQDRLPLKTHIEDSLDLVEIYPKRIGTVSGVSILPVGETDPKNTYCDFFDAGIPIGGIDGTLPLVAIPANDVNYTNYRIDGEKATVIFQTGMLAGKQFDIVQTDTNLSGYTHDDKRFRLVSQEIDGVTMPYGDFVPHKGDKYAVFGISMPTEYISAAETEMMQAAAKYLYENEDPRFTFTGELDGKWAKTDWVNKLGKIKLGGYVAFRDTQFQDEPVLIRIVGIKDFINNPHSPVIELSNVTVGGNSLSSALGKIDTVDVKTEDLHKEALSFSKRGFRSATETAKQLQNSLLNFTGAVNPITVQTMQLIVGDPSLQFRFVEDGTTDPPSVTIPEFVFHPTTKKFSIVGMGGDPIWLQHLTLGLTDMTYARPLTGYFVAHMAAFDSAELDVPTKKYFIYAQIVRATKEGHFLLSETAKLLEETVSGAPCYNLLVGVLNSENDGTREHALLYGFTEILPSRITTDRIVSQDGNSYFDLLNNAMKLGSFFDWNVTTPNTLTLKNAKISESLDVDGDADLAGFIFNNSVIKSSTKVNTGTDVDPVLEDAILIDGINGLIRFIANKLNTDYANTTERQTITIDSQNGLISVRSGTGSGGRVAYITSEGVFANKAGTECLAPSLGHTIKSSIVGLGFGNMDKDIYDIYGVNAICGVFGDATNEGSAPTFGGIFKRLKVIGEYLGLRTIEDTSATDEKTLTEYDRFISCYNTSAVTLYLPLAPTKGQILEIRRVNAQVTVIGKRTNGTGIQIHKEALYDSTVIGAGVGDTGRFIYDGNYWLYNYYGR